MSIIPQDLYRPQFILSMYFSIHERNGRHFFDAIPVDLSLRGDLKYVTYTYNTKDIKRIYIGYCTYFKLFVYYTDLFGYMLCVDHIFFFFLKLQFIFSSNTLQYTKEMTKYETEIFTSGISLRIQC